MVRWLGRVESGLVFSLHYPLPTSHFRNRSPVTISTVLIQKFGKFLYKIKRFGSFVYKLLGLAHKCQISLFRLSIYLSQ